MTSNFLSPEKKIELDKLKKRIAQAKRRILKKYEKYHGYYEYMGDDEKREINDSIPPQYYFDHDFVTEQRLFEAWIERL